MNQRIVAALCAVGLAALPGSRASAQQDPSPGAVVTDREALLPGLPELVCAAMTDGAEWSPDGRYVLAVRRFARFTSFAEPPVTEQSLVVWSSTTRRSVTVWSERRVQTGGISRQWLHGADVALVTAAVSVPPRPGQDPGSAAAEQTVLLRIDARRGAVRVLGVVRPTSQIAPSPRQPLAVIWSQDGGPLQTVRSDGTIASTVQLPEGRVPLELRWRPGGKEYAVRVLTPGKGNSARAAWLAVQPLTGQLSPAADPVAAAPPEAPEDGAAPRAGELRIRQGKGAVAEGESRQRISPLWLEYSGKSESPRMLITANGRWARLSPRGDAVLYDAEGSVWVVPLLRCPKEAYRAARAAAHRAVIVSNAKQAGLALLMYAQDDDEQLPGAEKPVQDLLFPYLKNADVLAGLVYTYAGGKLADIREPAKTELGYLPGDGGRAVIFADGHVMWRPDGE